MSLEGLLPEEVPRHRPIERDGVRIEAPSGWETRLRRAKPKEEEDRTFPVMHASTVPLPGTRADYGAGVVHKLGQKDVFVALIEMGEENAGTALYPEVDELPRVHPRMFSPNQLQRRLPGQGGVQVFFTYRGRAFCLYIVLGSHSQRIALAERVNELLDGLSVEGQQ